MGDEAFDRAWLDRAHAYITTMLCQPSVWFDGFFGEHRAGEDWAGSLVRWQGAVRLDERGGSEFRSEFSADLRLPKMHRKLKLIVTSQTRDDQTDVHPDEDPYDPGPSDDTVSDGENRVTAGLRYYLTDTQRVRLNLGAGIKLGDPVQPYFRVRLRYTEPLGRNTLLRLTPSAIWLTGEGFNRSLRLDLEQRFSENVLLRSSNSVVRKEMEPGIRWGSVLTLYDRVSSVTVIALEAAATGTSYPEDRVERYRVSTRVRSNFLREWLFLELEPEYYWPRDDLGEYRLYRAVTFRLEMQFHS